MQATATVGKAKFTLLSGLFLFIYLFIYLFIIFPQ